MTWVLIMLSLSVLQSVYSTPLQNTGKRRVINGLDIETIKEGDKVSYPKHGQKVTCHYVLTLANGTEIDSSRDKGKPFSFNIGLGEVIAGWDEGVMEMSLGEEARLTISPSLGYGVGGVPGHVPPNAVLLFDVELLRIE